MLRDLCRAGIEGMTNMSGSGSEKKSLYKELVVSILSLILAIVIVAFIGKWLWNNTIAELFTVVRPARSVWHIIGLMLFISLIR
jgi:hypothetical protein